MIAASVEFVEDQLCWLQLATARLSSSTLPASAALEAKATRLCLRLQRSPATLHPDVPRPSALARLLSRIAAAAPHNSHRDTVLQPPPHTTTRPHPAIHHTTAIQMAPSTFASAAAGSNSTANSTRNDSGGEWSVHPPLCPPRDFSAPACPNPRRAFDLLLPPDLLT